MSSIRLPRRQFLALGAAGLGGTLLTGCDRLSESSDVQEGLFSRRLLSEAEQAGDQFAGSPCLLADLACHVGLVWFQALVSRQ